MDPPLQAVWKQAASRSPDPDSRDAVDGETHAVEEELRLHVGKGPTDAQQVGGLLDSEQVRLALGPRTVRWV